jgi:hypothetical protein
MMILGYSYHGARHEMDFFHGVYPKKWYPKSALFPGPLGHKFGQPGNYRWEMKTLGRDSCYILAINLYYSILI